MVEENILPLPKRRRAIKGKRKPLPLPKREAQEKINTIAKDTSRIFIPERQHASERSELRAFTRSDIIEILREGIIVSDPVFENGRWRYKVEYARFRRHPYGAAVVTIIRKKEQDLLVVTVMWLDKR